MFLKPHPLDIWRIWYIGVHGLDNFGCRNGLDGQDFGGLDIQDCQLPWFFHFMCTTSWFAFCCQLMSKWSDNGRGTKVASIKHWSSNKWSKTTYFFSKRTRTFQQLKDTFLPSDFQHLRWHYETLFSTTYQIFRLLYHYQNRNFCTQIYNRQKLKIIKGFLWVMRNRVRYVFQWLIYASKSSYDANHPTSSNYQVRPNSNWFGSFGCY